MEQHQYLSFLPPETLVLRALNAQILGCVIGFDENVLTGDIIIILVWDARSSQNYSRKNTEQQIHH